MAHAQKPDFVFRRKGWVHLNRRGRQFSRLLAAEVCASAVVMLDTPCSKVVWRVLATHSIRQFPLHFPSRASPCAITFQLDSTQRCERLLCHFGLLGPEIEGDTKLRTVGSYLSKDTAQPPRTLEPLSIPLSEPQISHCPYRFWGPPSLQFNGHWVFFRRGYRGNGTWSWPFTSIESPDYEWVEL